MEFVTTEMLLASAAVAVGSTVQGSVGFGLALIAAPVLVLVDPRLVPGPMLLCGAVLTIGMGAREGRSMDLRGVGWALVGRVPGAAAGAAMLALIPAREMAIVFGVMVLVAVAISASGKRIPLRRATLLGAGVLSGIMGTTSAIGGPPVAILYSHESGPRMRGTMAGYFTVGTAISLAVLAFVGRFGRTEVELAAALVPAVLLGFVLSNHLKPYLDRGYTRGAVLAVTALGGLAVVVKHLL